MGGRSHFFRLRLRFCSKFFESGSGSRCVNFSNLRVRLLFRLLRQSRQPKITNDFTSEIPTQIPATADIDSGSGSDTSKIFDSGSVSAFERKRRILLQSTPEHGIRGHLCFEYEQLSTYGVRLARTFRAGKCIIIFITFCDFPLIIRCGKYHVMISFTGCAPHI